MMMQTPSAAAAAPPPVGEARKETDSHGFRPAHRSNPASGGNPIEQKPRSVFLLCPGHDRFFLPGLPPRSLRGGAWPRRGNPFPLPYHFGETKTGGQWPPLHHALSGTACQLSDSLRAALTGGCSLAHACGRSPRGRARFCALPRKHLSGSADPPPLGGEAQGKGTDCRVGAGPSSQ